MVYISFVCLFVFCFYFWLHWVFVAVCGLSLVAASGGYSSLQCTDFSLSWLLGAQASVVVAHGLSCSAACGILPGQGSNPWPLHWGGHWQADSQPLRHQGSPWFTFLHRNLTTIFLLNFAFTLIFLTMWGFFVLFCFCFFYFWLHWVLVAARGLSLDETSGSYSSLRCTGFSLRWLLLLRSTGSRCSSFSSCSMSAQ